MRIDKIDLSNFKNFEQLYAEFTPGVNLFVGGNGSGKTSTLEALNVAIGGFFGSQEQKMQRGIEFDEIRIASGKRQPLATVKASSELLTTWSRSIKSNTKANDVKGIKPISEYGRAFFKKFEDEDDRTIAPLISFCSTQRLFKDSSSSSKQKYDPANGRRNGYLQCLSESAIKGVLNEWFANAVTRRATLQIKEIDQIDYILENVEAAIKKTLILFLDLPKDFSLKIYPDPDFDNELFVNYDSEHNLPLSYYSDGFRNLLYLVFDLTWRASQLNPWLDLNNLSQSVFGVVTIDEIDLHLHPKWQAKAIDILQLLFPNIQFFITTHSPTVVANFQNGTLYVISENKIAKHPSDFFGKQINYVIREILGGTERHVPTQKKLDVLFTLIDENKKDEYNPLLQELTDLLGDDDIDIVKATALVDWQDSLENE